MIVLEERKSVNLPTLTSLFFGLGVFEYNQYVYELLAQTSSSYYEPTSKEFEFPTNKLFFLVNTLTTYDDVRFIPMAEKGTNHDTVGDYVFKVKPYQYQLEGIEYGLNHNKWLLLDSCGLGKTLQMIYLADILRQRGELEHCLIVCGVNSLKYNWEKEIKKFSEATCTILGAYLSPRGHKRIKNVADRIKDLKNGVEEFFVITNIETLQSSDFATAYRKSKSKFGMIVVDECHNLRNPNAKSVRTLMKLKANRCIGLSGTVIMNVPENAFVPLKWTDNIQCDYSNFKHTYNMYGGYGGKTVIGYKNLDVLKDLISSCSLRRLKEDVLDLPDKTYMFDYVELSKEQRELYDNVEEGIAAELDLLPNKGKNISVIKELAMYTRLRQVTECPSFLSSKTSKCAKLDRAEELVEEITAQGDKILLFCSYKATAQELAKRLHKYNPVVCTGDTPMQEIEFNKTLFEQDENCKVMVATWQKMGTGHNLTAASYVIFISTPWTDADFQQAVDRIYRIGQNKKVFAITLISTDTYDERVQEILERKEQLSGHILDNKEARDLNLFTE